MNHELKLLEERNSVIEPFLDMVCQYPLRHALWVNDVYYSYSELYEQAIQIADWLSCKASARSLIFSQRALTAYVGIIGTLLVDKAYVPLNPKMPAARNATMIELADATLVIVDVAVEREFNEVLEHLASAELDVLFLHTDSLPAWTKNFSNIRFYTKAALPANHNEFEYVSNKSKDACLLFTSGSTGIPKGVMLSHENILAYISQMIISYGLNDNDHVSQMTELTFDFSVQDMFMTWAVGACVYAFPENYFIGLPKYLNDNKITFMTTVPSTARLLSELGKLQENSLPYLRQNIFGGEPFSDSIALQWQRAAPNTNIINVCGPTEATIAYLFYPWHEDQIVTKGLRNCIPLGKPFINQEILIINENGESVQDGVVGELCLSGTQVIDAYWRNEQLTQKQFIHLPDKRNVLRKWYKTGDMVIWTDEDGIVFKGRVDDQIQIRGCRVEKLEIERMVREVADTESVAVIPWPVADDGTVQGVITFVSHTALSERDIYIKCRTKLPDYMAPKEVHILDNIPLNFNGKIDYLKLKQLRMNVNAKDLSDAEAITNNG